MNKVNFIFRVLCASFITFSIISCDNSTESYSGPDPDKNSYGPQSITYDLPDVKGKIYFVAPNGAPDSEGIDSLKPSSIESAIAKAVTGDAIIMRGGTYRTGNLTFNQGIIIQPYKNENPVLKGTLVAENWNKTPDGLWSIKWEHLFPASPESWWNRKWEERFTPLHRFNNDGIFIDGNFLESAGSKKEVTENTCFVDYDTKEIFIGTNPEGKFIEITAFRKAIIRTTQDVNGKKPDNKGPVIKGLTITQYPDTMVHIAGYYPQGVAEEKDFGKDVVGTVFENCTFSKCFRIGVFALGDSMVMRHCKITDTNTEGLYIVASSDVLLEGNIFANNNIEKWTGFYPSSVKIFNQTHRVVCRNNLIIDQPNSNGLWYDVGNKDGVFINNWVENIGDINKFTKKAHIWSNFSGFFYEISSDAVCAGNVFLNCEQGSFVLNSANVKVYNNTYINSTASFGRNERGDEKDHFGWHILTAPGVDSRFNHIFKNNIFYMEKKYRRPDFTAWQPANMCERLSKSQLSEMNNNFYLNESEEKSDTIIVWCPANNEKCTANLIAPEELTALYPGFETESKFYNGISTTFFNNFSKNDFSIKAENKEKIKVKKAAFAGAYYMK
ncbi:MAG: right-handed parallel beta-helix repeat-containing protein [Prolixibacteraceae bacterium]|nr:right-handed parallel beta-helix repeat-containing protein [Prolixibacteraceae bacterium]